MTPRVRAVTRRPAAIWPLTLKELRETLRDRRTLLTLVLMPALVYPLLSVVTQRFLFTSAGSFEKTPVHFGFESYDGGVDFMKEFHRAEAAYHASIGDAEYREQVEKSPFNPRFVESSEAKDLEAAVRTGEVDVGIVWKSEPGGPIRFDLLRIPGSPRGEPAAKEIEVRFEALREAELASAFAQAGVDYEPPVVWKIDSVIPKEATGSPLALILPVILIMMTITGAVYPSIDLTAGERERGTMEILMASPAPRVHLLFAKYVAVVTVAAMTATMNLGALAVTAWVSPALRTLLFGDRGFSFATLGLVFFFIVLFAAFFSSLLLAVTSFARSFKEAQAYLIPLMLAAMTPALISMLPGVQLTPGMALAPVLNVTLLARETLDGTATLPATAVTILSTIFYGAAALGLAAKCFEQDGFLIGGDGKFDALGFRPDAPMPHPSAGAAAFSLAILFPAQILLATAVGGALAERGVLAALGANAGVTLFLFALLPTLWLAWQRVRPLFELKFSARSLLFVPGLALLAATSWIPAHETIVLSQDFFGTIVTPETMERAAGAVEKLRQAPLWLVLATLAFVPAIAEEIYFRGLLLRAFRARQGAWQATLLAAIAFGGFHVFATLFTPERFLPTALLGVMLGYVYCRTGNLFLSAAVHMVHNGLLLTVSFHHETLAKWFPNLSANVAEGELPHLPASWIAMGILGSIVGVGSIELARRLGARRETPPEAVEPAEARIVDG